jgi:hypothetical protein
MMQITRNGIFLMLMFFVVALLFANAATSASSPTVSIQASNLRLLQANQFYFTSNRFNACIERTLRARGAMATTMRQQNRLVLTTPFKWVSANGLKKIARPERFSTGEWIGGRYRVVFIIVPERGGHSRLTIIPEIFGEPAPGPAKMPPLMGPVGGPMRGAAVGSNGSLEERWLKILKKNCGG